MQRDRKRIKRIDHKENRVIYRRAKHTQRRGYLVYATMIDGLVEKEGWKLAEPPVEYYEGYFEPYYDEDYGEWVYPTKLDRANYLILVPGN